MLKYDVKVEQPGFKASSANGAEVLVGKQTSLDFRLEPGLANETINVTAVEGTNLQSTEVSSNLNDQLYQNIPVARSVTSLFYLAPGATDSLGGGVANPSIAGGSALDNLYIADGVNITDSAFGGLGTFSRSYGSLGTGINTSFIKEVQVKTGGFEPQYGQSEGGIINIIRNRAAMSIMARFTVSLVRARLKLIAANPMLLTLIKLGKQTVQKLMMQE
jgi:hypothetical protein